MADHEDVAPEPTDAEEVPAGFRAVPITDIGHPLADKVGETADGERWVITETRAPVVFLNQSRANLLAIAARDGRRPVLVSDELSVLSPVCANVWRRSGGVWVVRDPSGGLRNGLDGRRLTAIEDAWRMPPPTGVEEVALNHLRPVALEAMQLSVIISARHPARESTVLGGAIEQVAQAVDATMACWGPHEPVGAVWDRAALTAELRRQMPGETDGFASAPGLTSVITARRTRHGVEEVTHAYVEVGKTDPAGFEALRDRLSAALRTIATTSMPLVALVCARPGHAGSFVPPYLVAPPIPLALLVGAPAVRSFGLDVQDFRARFGAEIIGRARIPGLLFDLGPFQPGAWGRLDEILTRFDPDRLAAAFGGADAEIGRERPVRSGPPGGGPDAQP